MAAIETRYGYAVIIIIIVIINYWQHTYILLSHIDMFGTYSTYGESNRNPNNLQQSAWDRRQYNNDRQQWRHVAFRGNWVRIRVNDHAYIILYIFFKNMFKLIKT